METISKPEQIIGVTENSDVMSRLIDNVTPIKCNDLRNDKERDNIELGKIGSPVERVKFVGIDDDNDSYSSKESLEEKLPPVPDGGWGWVVVFSAFFVSACVDGLGFSYGLLQEEFTRYFGASQSQTALIGSFFISIPLIMGPLLSALVDKYGCRATTMGGSLVATVGFLLAAVSNSITMLCLTFGIMSGFALGIFFVTSVVSVTFWFEKRRNLAVSLAVSGIGFGTLIYSPLTYYLLKIYDWRNTVVILAGTILNMAVCGALMRDPEWLEIKRLRERREAHLLSKKTSSVGSVSSRSIGDESVYLDAEELKSLLKSGQSPDNILATLASNIAEAEQLEATTQMNAEENKRRTRSTLHLPTFIQDNEKVPEEVIKKFMENKRLYNFILQNYPHMVTRRKSEVDIDVNSKTDRIEPSELPNVSKAQKLEDEQNATMENGMKKKQTDENKPNVKEPKSKLKEKEHKGVSQRNWMRRLSKADSRYFTDMPLYTNTMTRRRAMLVVPNYRVKASSLPELYRNSTWSLESESDDEMKWYQRMWQSFTKMLNLRMFLEFHFLLFNIVAFVLSMFYIMPYFFLNSYMNELNTEGGPTMISIIGVTNSIGIVIFGWAGDQPWVNVVKTYAICLIICGISVAAYPIIITNFWCLAINSAVFGLTLASSYSYTVTILMDLMSLEHFTAAYGLILLTEGVGHLLGPPVGGLFYDLTGNWDLSFYIGGLWIILCGFAVCVIAYTKNMRIYGNGPLFKEDSRNKLERESSDNNM